MMNAGPDPTRKGIVLVNIYPFAQVPGFIISIMLSGLR
jgi:hypothetical protein